MHTHALSVCFASLSGRYSYVKYNLIDNTFFMSKNGFLVHIYSLADQTKMMKSLLVGLSSILFRFTGLQSCVVSKNKEILNPLPQFSVYFMVI